MSMRTLGRRLAFLGVLLGLLLTLTAAYPNIALAADSFNFGTSVIDFGSDINSTSFTSELTKIFNGMQSVFKSIVVILTVASAAMLVLGIEDGKKTMWQFMLGIGLACNFGYTLWLLFNGTGIFESVDSIVAAHKDMDATAEILKNSKANGNDDILTEIMAVYSGTIISNGMPVLQAIALRLTIALAALEGGYKIAMELYSGDKVKFLVATAFKVGFFCFLIKEWTEIGQALSAFFQSAGFLAAGESGFSTADPTATDNNTAFRPDSIWHNAWAFLNLCLNGKDAAGDSSGFPWASAVDTGLITMGLGLMTGGVGAIVSMVVTLLFVLFIVGFMIFISVEMFVARIEFYTMLMLSVIFLPFGVTERLAFLSNSAISLMFNSGAKMMVICFLQVMVAKILSAYLTNLQGNPFKDFSILCQLLIMCVFFAYVTKKLPELVSSFLNGSPALSGGGMIQQAKSAVQQTQQVITTAAMTVGTGVGAVGGASAAASANAGSGLSGKMSQLPGMKGKVGHAIDTFGVLARAGAQNYAAHNPLIRGYARGLKAVIGEDGQLQGDNVNFAKGVRRLAGLEGGNETRHTESIRDIAAGRVPMRGPGNDGASSEHGTGGAASAANADGKPENTNPTPKPFTPTGQNAGQGFTETTNSKEAISNRETTTSREAINNRETTTNREAVNNRETTTSREAVNTQEASGNKEATGSEPNMGHPQKK